MSRLINDENFNTVQLMELSAPQNGIVIKAIADVATANLSGTLTKGVIRVHASVDCWLMFTVTDLVTAATGHKILAAACPYDLPRPAGKTKISVIAAGSTPGTLDISELG
ncbi:MAG: hypothetical protein ACOYL3_06980 [Desulfuromonadaceae bacterium]